mgnify:CR=1 FL=1
MFKIFTCCLASKFTFHKFLIETSYGKEDENGVWQGIVRSLVSHEADLAIAGLVVTATRERVVDFSQPFMKTGISVMILKPEKRKMVMLFIGFSRTLTELNESIVFENRVSSPSWLHCLRKFGCVSLLPTFSSVLSCSSLIDCPLTNGTFKMKKASFHVKSSQSALLFSSHLLALCIKVFRVHYQVS